MYKERVGRAEWLALKVGETGIFTLPDKRKKEYARVAQQHVKELYDYQFKRIKVSEPLTIAYMRVG